MEKLLKPIPEKHLYRVAEIKKVLKSYAHKTSPVAKILNNSQFQQMKKIKKAQKLNTENSEVKELKNVLIHSDQHKDNQMTHIYNQIRNSSLRTLSVKASTPLKRIIKKMQRTKTSFDDQQNIPSEIKTKYSNLQIFFRQKSNTIANKQNQLNGTKNNMSSSKWWQNQMPKIEPELKLSGINKSSRLPKIKSRTHLQFIVDQIQSMIDRNMVVINQNLEKLNQKSVHTKVPEHIHDFEESIHSSIIANYKPWSHQSVIKKNQKQIKYFGRNRRKSMSRIYERPIFKLSTDTFKSRDSFTFTQEHQEIGHIIRESLYKRDYIVVQSKFGKENRSKNRLVRYSNEIDLGDERIPITHRRIRTDVPLTNSQDL